MLNLLQPVPNAETVKRSHGVQPSRKCYDIFIRATPPSSGKGCPTVLPMIEPWSCIFMKDTTRQRVIVIQGPLAPSQLAP